MSGTGRRDVVAFRVGTDQKNCGSCAQFFYMKADCKLGRCGRCHVIKGCIYAHDLCDLWERPAVDAG
jgi:hypothetical protein